jgi:hypothetical protein
MNRRWLANGRPGADLEVLPRGGAAHRLLHGDGALESVVGEVEGDDEAVAEPLHFVAAVRRDGLAEEAMVSLENALGLLISGSLEEPS